MGKIVELEDIYIHPHHGASVHPWAMWTGSALRVVYERERILRRLNLQHYPLRIATPVTYFYYLYNKYYFYYLGKKVKRFRFKCSCIMSTQRLRASGIRYGSQLAYRWQLVLQNYILYNYRKAFTVRFIQLYNLQQLLVVLQIQKPGWEIVIVHCHLS